MHRITCFLCTCLISALIFSCDRSDESVTLPPTSPLGSTSSDKQSSGTPRPNYVTGKATTAAGKPLAGVQIGIGGTTIAHGENTHFKTTTRADGTYSLPVPHGLYKVSAKVLANYHNRSYLLPLHPVDGSVEDYDSEAGIVKDFIWHISGLKPGQTPGSTTASHYYGGHIGFHDRNGYEDRVGFNADAGPGSKPIGKHIMFEPGTILSFAAVPDGPLIDGSAGKELKFEFTIDETMSYDYNWRPDWYDIPIGRYKLTAEIRPPAGKAKPARLAAISPYGAAGARIPLPAASATIDFIPNTSQASAGGTHPVHVYVME